MRLLFGDCRFFWRRGWKFGGYVGIFILTALMTLEVALFELKVVAIGGVELRAEGDGVATQQFEGCGVLRSGSDPGFDQEDHGVIGVVVERVRFV